VKWWQLSVSAVNFEFSVVWRPEICQGRNSPRQLNRIRIATRPKSFSLLKEGTFTSFETQYKMAANDQFYIRY